MVVNLINEESLNANKNEIYKDSLNEKNHRSHLRSEVEKNITSLSIVDDEQKIQQSIKDEIEELKRQEELKKIKAEEEKNAKEREEEQKILTRHILIFSSIGLGIIFCIVIIIIEHKKRKIK